MKYTGKWWDNPKRTEREREVASGIASALTALLIAMALLYLIF